MILTLVTAAGASFFAFLYGKTLKKLQSAIESLNSNQAYSKKLTYDIEVTQRERERLLDRVSYLEERLNSFTRENEMIGSKNIELTQLYSLAKEEANKLKFQMIELEESINPIPCKSVQKRLAVQKKDKITKKK